MPHSGVIAAVVVHPAASHALPAYQPQPVYAATRSGYAPPPTSDATSDQEGEDDDDDEFAGDMSTEQGYSGFTRRGLDEHDDMDDVVEEEEDDDDGDEEDDDDGDEEDDDDDDCDRVALVQVPYRTVLIRYALVPFLAFFALLGISLLAVFGWPPHDPEQPTRWPHQVAWGALFFGLSVQSLSQSLRIPIYTGVALLPLRPTSITVLHTCLHTLALECLRFVAISIIVPRLSTTNDGWTPSQEAYPTVWEQWPSFAASYWTGIGWALGEVAVGTWQTYTQLGYYASVLPPPFPRSLASSGITTTSDAPAPLPSSQVNALKQRLSQHHHQSYMDQDPGTLTPYADEENGGVSNEGHVAQGHSAISTASRRRRRVARSAVLSRTLDIDLAEERLEAELWEFVAVQERKSIESLLGVPLPNIPAIISALWRIDSLLLNVGLTLVLSALHARHETERLLPTQLAHIAPLFVALAAGHAGVSVGWVLGMRVLGAPTTTYASLFVALGVFFWGLGSWRALV